MKNKVSESIFESKHCIIPMADVAFIQKRNIGGCDSIVVVMNGTTYNAEQDEFNNAVYLSDSNNKLTGYKSTDKTDFLKAWCNYRYELEKEVNEYE